MHVSAQLSAGPACSPGGWKAKARTLVATRPPCVASPGTCGTPQPSQQRLQPSNAVAGVGVSVPGGNNNSSGSGSGPSSSGRAVSPMPTSRSSASSPSAAKQRPLSQPLQILVRAAAEARVASAAPAELSEVNSRLAATSSWPALQVLALQYQGRLDQQSVVAVLRRAAQLAAGTSSPSQAEQYACARFLESMAMSCANLIPAMAPGTVAAVLSTLGALGVSGMVVMRQVPYMVVALVQALILASLPQLHHYSPPQLAYVLRGCALLSPSGLPEVWLDEWQSVTAGAVLRQMPPDALDAVVASLQTLYQRQNWLPEDGWLGELLQAVEAQLGDYGGSELRHLVVALAGLEVRPHNGWLGSFRAAFDQRVAAAEMAPHEIAGVLYAFTKLEVAFA
ncbi:hypothetical protein CHLRE_02g109200v5 [Chlamydomonas reinhardtii]|uniref:Uncharacterized protein n=1 Tax=Chlamydomonas reinhardtii TaxID=3055 RepID=A0A2K3E2V8_CHLRE|nr:uncharacterized protein CHLRE_02g109200v5 [Chlamydomonas reinhardtii]PNW87104.1 hypothetical protein CHLRE_02g109200v5 [Chlamydomonas reinhardtii]